MEWMRPCRGCTPDFGPERAAYQREKDLEASRPVKCPGPRQRRALLPGGDAAEPFVGDGSERRGADAPSGAGERALRSNGGEEAAALGRVGAQQQSPAKDLSGAASPIKRQCVEGPAAAAAALLALWTHLIPHWMTQWMPHLMEPRTLMPYS